MLGPEVSFWTIAPSIAAAPVSFAGAKTLADLLAFFAFHEAYHLGQVGFIRKQLGHSSLAG